jgi:hypothetical protein
MCKVCAECTTAMEIIFGTPIVLLGDVGQVESWFDLFGDSVNIGARQVHGLRRMYHMHRNHFGQTQCYT